MKNAHNLQRLQGGDLDTFRAIVEDYHPKVYRYCFRFIRNREAAEEITSDVFLQLWKKRAQLKTSCSVSGLLFKIARDLAIDHLRKVARKKSLQQVYLREYQASLSSVTIEEEMYFEELLEVADSAVERMPPVRRRVFEMHYNEDLSNEQIARALGISAHTVRAHLFKAFRFIKGYLQAHSDILPLMLLVMGQN